MNKRVAKRRAYQICTRILEEGERAGGFEKHLHSSEDEKDRDKIWSAFREIVRAISDKGFS